MCQIMKFDNRLKICITTNSHLGICKRPSRSITSLDFATTGTTEQTRWPRSHAKKTLHVGSGAEGAHSCAWERLIRVCVSVRVCMVWATHLILMWGRAEWSLMMMLNEERMTFLLTVPCAMCCCVTSHLGRLCFPSQTREKHELNKRKWLIDWLGRNTSMTSYFRWRKRQREESLIKLAYGVDELKLVR